MFNHPYFLLLLMLPLAFLVFSRRRYYLRHAYVSSLSKSRPARKNPVQSYCTGFGWVLLVLAAADFCWGVTTYQKRQPVHKYVLINDGSGSMVERGRPRGVGQALGIVYKGNEALLEMLGRRSDGSKDLVGAVVFADDAFVVSYLVDDPKFVGRKLAAVNYAVAPMGLGTETDKALWAGLEMILANEKPPAADLDKLQTRMFGTGHVYKSDDVRDVVEKYRPLAENSCVIVFTDGEFDSPSGHSGRMSVYKIMHLYKDLGVKVYIISVATVDDFLKRYCAETGGHAAVYKDFNIEVFRRAYEDIVASQRTRDEVVEVREKQSFSLITAIFALYFLSFGLLLRVTLDRNYTETQ